MSFRSPSEVAFDMWIDLEYSYGNDNVPDVLADLLRMDSEHDAIGLFTFTDAYRVLTDQLDAYDAWTHTDRAQSLMMELTMMYQHAMAHRTNRVGHHRSEPIGYT